MSVLQRTSTLRYLVFILMDINYKMEHTCRLLIIISKPQFTHLFKPMDIILRINTHRFF